MSVVDTVLEIADEIRQKNQELADMVAAWESGDDTNMAENDPGLQFAKEQEIDELLNKMAAALRGRD